jgi:hypothetical protein
MNCQEEQIKQIGHLTNEKIYLVFIDLNCHLMPKV